MRELLKGNYRDLMMVGSLTVPMWDDGDSSAIVESGHQVSGSELLEYDLDLERRKMTNKYVF